MLQDAVAKVSQTNIQQLHYPPKYCTSLTRILLKMLLNAFWNTLQNTFLAGVPQTGLFAESGSYSSYRNDKEEWSRSSKTLFWAQNIVVLQNY